jgi:signal transduction histidine kinase
MVRSVASHIRPRPDSVISNGRAARDDSAGSSAAEVRRPAVDHDRIAQNLNDVVAHRLFAAGFDLHVALGLIGDHRAIGTIHHAIGGLDQAIRELRNTAYELGPRDGPASP